MISITNTVTWAFVIEYLKLFNSNKSVYNNIYYYECICPIMYTCTNNKLTP